MSPVGTRRSLLHGNSRWWGNWYLADGAPSPLAAYQPKNAPSYDVSRVNLITPGSYDAVVRTTPTWASATGWTFVKASSQCLTCPYVPLTTDDHNLAMIVRVVNYTGSGACCGTTSQYGGNYFQIYPTATTISYCYGVNDRLKLGGLTSASVVLGIADTEAYKDGVAQSAALNGIMTTYTYPSWGIGIGSSINWGNSVLWPFGGDILAWALWVGNIPTGAQMTAISSALALI